MITYREIPTAERWETDVRSTLGAPTDPQGAAARVNQDHVLAAIHALLAQNDAIRSADPERAAYRRHLIAVYLHEATSYWLEKGDRMPKLMIPGASAEPRFVAGLAPGQHAPVTALQDVSRRVLRDTYTFLDTDEKEAIRAAVVHGVGLENTQADEDEIKRGDPQVVWLATAAARLRYKLRFRNGLAYRIAQPHLAFDLTMKLFTTTPEESEDGDGVTHFVMDAGGHVYCGYDKAKGKAFKFFHSSLIGGQPVLAAGMMQVVEGQVRLIRNASGHYKPDGRHLAIMLQRLRLYGVDLSQVRLQKHDSPGQLYSAAQVVEYNGWPS